MKTKTMEGISLFKTLLQLTVNSLDPIELMQLCQMTYKRRHEDVKAAINEGMIGKLHTREMLNFMLKSGIFTRLSNAPRDSSAITSMADLFEGIAARIAWTLEDENVLMYFKQSKVIARDKRYDLVAGRLDIKDLKVSELIKLCEYLAIYPVDVINATIKATPESAPTAKEREEISALMPELIDLM